VTNLSSLVIAGCPRNEYKFSLLISHINGTYASTDKRQSRELFKEGTATLKKDTTSKGEKRSYLILRNLISVGPKAAT